MKQTRESFLSGHTDTYITDVVSLRDRTFAPEHPCITDFVPWFGLRLLALSGD